MAIRSRRRAQVLPGIGEEAYTGDGWAIARRGDTVIMLQLHGQGRTANPTYLYWLISTAVGRLPAPAAPVG
jgi:glutamine cyclotransferase